MAYISNNPPIQNISLLSAQGCVRRLWHSASFLMILNGEVQVQVGDHATYLNNNALMLVEPDVPFDITGHGSNLLMIVCMDYDLYMRGRAGRQGRFVCNSAEDDQRDYSTLRHMLSHLAMDYFGTVECKELRQLELCCSMLYYLNMSHFAPGGPESGSHESWGAQIIAYIENNYTENIRLDDLAQATFRSPSYLSRQFKALTNMNFKAYLEEVRLRHAVEDMRGSDHTITAIAYNNGFPNVTALSNAFRKKYGVSPNEFRRTLPEAEPVPGEQLPYHEVSYDNVQEHLEQLRGSEPVKHLDIYRFPDQVEYLVEDVSDAQPVTPIWRQMINVGTLKGLTNSNAQAQLAMLQEGIGFRYARVENVLAEEMMPKLPDGQYNFSYFDRAIGMLLSLKFTPFLDLSYEGDFGDGNRIASRAESLYRGDEPRRQMGENEFVNKVSALIRHCINTYGTGEVEKWGVELCVIHNFALEFLETPEEFARRFRAVYELIKAWLPNMLVGGPEQHISQGTGFIDAALDLLSRWGIRPDFVSLCAVPYEPAPNAEEKGLLILSSDPEYIPKQVRAVREVVRSRFGDEVPIWVTVLSQDVRTRNHMNDSCYQAAFLVKTTLALIGLADVIGYWQFSDIDAEYIDTTRILFGGNGILSKDGLKKPGFSALKRLSSISTLMIRREDDLLITTNGINTYNIVLCNYAHFTDLYCLSNGEGVTYDNVYTMFGDAATKNIRGALRGVRPGRYKVITTTLNREHGSLFDEWLRYGIIDDLQPHDIRYLRDIVHPQRAVLYQNCEDGTLSVSVQMLPHEVKFLLILREL